MEGGNFRCAAAADVAAAAAEEEEEEKEAFRKVLDEAEIVEEEAV